MTDQREQAIRTEEREKVLGELLSDEAVRAGANAEYDWLNPHASSQQDAEERDSGFEPFKAGLEAALASLPVDGDEKPCRRCGGKRRVRVEVPPPGYASRPCPDCSQPLASLPLDAMEEPRFSCTDASEESYIANERGELERELVDLKREKPNLGFPPPDMFQRARAKGLRENRIVEIETTLKRLDESAEECDVPPLHWRCTRPKGHDGPCAALPDCQPPDSLDRGGEAVCTDASEEAYIKASREEFEAEREQLRGRLVELNRTISELGGEDPSWASIRAADAYRRAQGNPVPVAARCRECGAPEGAHHGPDCVTGNSRKGRDRAFTRPVTVDDCQPPDRGGEACERCHGDREGPLAIGEGLDTIVPCPDCGGPERADEEDGASLIAAERRRQVEAEGWSPEHDDQHDSGEMAVAAALYAAPPLGSAWGKDAPDGWPWEPEWWKPKDQISNLVRAGALLAAEIDRLQRAVDCTDQPAPKEEES